MKSIKQSINQSIDLNFLKRFVFSFIKVISRESYLLISYIDCTFYCLKFALFSFSSLRVFQNVWRSNNTNPVQKCSTVHHSHSLATIILSKNVQLLSNANDQNNAQQFLLSVSRQRYCISTRNVQA